MSEMGFAPAHEGVCAAMRANPDALARLGPWGFSGGGSVERVLASRRALLLSGLD